MFFIILLSSLCEDVSGQHLLDNLMPCQNVINAGGRCAYIAYKCVCAGNSDTGLTPCATARDCIYGRCQCEHFPGQATKVCVKCGGAGGGGGSKPAPPSNPGPPFKSDRPGLMRCRDDRDCNVLPCNCAKEKGKEWGYCTQCKQRCPPKPMPPGKNGLTSCASGSDCCVLPCNCDHFKGSKGKFCVNCRSSWASP